MENPSRFEGKRRRYVEPGIITAAICSLQNSKGSTVKEIFKYLTTKDVHFDENRTRLSILYAQKKHLINNCSRNFKGKPFWHVCQLGVDDNGCPCDTCVKPRRKRVRKKQEDNNDACELSCGCNEKPVQFCANGELVQFCASKDTKSCPGCPDCSPCGKAKCKRKTKKCCDKNDTCEKHCCWPDEMFVQFCPNGELVKFCASKEKKSCPGCPDCCPCDKAKNKRTTKKAKNCNGAGELCCGPDKNPVQFCANGELVEFCAKPKCNSADLCCGPDKNPVQFCANRELVEFCAKPKCSTAEPKRSPCAKKQKTKCCNGNVETKCMKYNTCKPRKTRSCTCKKPVKYCSCPKPPQPVCE